jgi:hypothetical protein
MKINLNIVQGSEKGNFSGFFSLFFAYSNQFFVYLQPSAIKKANKGKAMRPIIRSQLMCGNNPPPTWSIVIVIIAIIFKTLPDKTRVLFIYQIYHKFAIFAIKKVTDGYFYSCIAPKRLSRF